MELKMLVATVVYLMCIGAARADDADPKYKFSCLHYCQKHNYGHPIKYCCRAARVVLGTIHSTTTTHAATAHASTAPAAAAHNAYATLTTTATLSTKTLNTVVPVVATPLLANLKTLSLGPAASANVPGTLHTTTHPDSDVPRDLGECPPARDYCPRTSHEPRLTLCHADYDCAPTDKCCYDACIASHVCKTTVTVHRHRRSIHRAYGSRDPGAAAATEVILREDGEPVHVLLDQNGNPVAATDGDLLAITRDFSPGAIPSRVSSAKVPVSGHNLVYVVENENGDVVEDASGNTLTLVRYTNGPTLLIHDEGISVVRGKHAPADGVFSGRVRKTLVPDLTIQSRRRYSRETSKQGSYHSKRFSGSVLTGQGKTVTLQGEERLTVVNSDGVTFVFDLPAVADAFLEGQYASVAVVDTDRLNTDALVDGEGNVMVDDSGRLITVQDIMDTVTQTNFYNTLVVVDGRGNTVTLLNVNRNVVILVDQFGHQLSVSPGEYDFILEDYSTEATVHHTETGLSVIVDGTGNILEDKYGYPLLIMPFQERHRRSIIDYFLFDEKDEENGSGGDREGSGEDDTETSVDYDETEIPPERKRSESDMSEDLEALEQEDAMTMMQGRSDEEEEMDGLGVLNFMRRHLLTVEPLEKVRRSTLSEEGDPTEVPVTTGEPDDNLEGCEKSEHRTRRHEQRWKSSMDDDDMSLDHMYPQDWEERDARGGSGDGTHPREVNETDGYGVSDNNTEPQEDENNGNGDVTDPQVSEKIDGSGEDDHRGMKETTDGPDSTGHRRRRFALPMLPLLMMKRAVPPEPLEDDDTTEASGYCQDGVDCEDMETTDDPEYRRKRRQLNLASKHYLDSFDYVSEPEADMHVTTTEKTMTDHTDTDVTEVTTEPPPVSRGGRSMQQEHPGRDYSENRIRRKPFHLPEMMKDFGFHTINMADDMVRINEVLPNPSTIVREMTSRLNLSVKNPNNFVFILSYSVERIINTVIEVLQMTDIGFQEDPDGRVLDVVLTSVMKVILDLLEEAMDLAAHVRRLTLASGQSVYP